MTRRTPWPPSPPRCGRRTRRRRGAHRLAGGALSVGLSQLAGRTRLAEEALRAGDLPTGWAALHDLLATVQSDLDALAQWQAGRQAGRRAETN